MTAPRVLYRVRPANWLMARPWSRRWRYPTIYRTCREGFPRLGNERDEEVLRRHPRMFKVPQGRLRSAWLALTFPHVHHPDEL